MRAEVEDGDEVRMVEQAEGTRLLMKTGDDVRASGDRSGEELERDVASELDVAGAIHLSHSARPDERDDLVTANLIAQLQIHDLNGRSNSTLAVDRWRLAASGEGERLIGN